MKDPLGVEALAGRCAQQLPMAASSFAHDRGAFDAALQALLAQIQRRDPQLAFDRDGRPAAIAAIRQALPVTEADLFDAVLEDVACELAAWQEALYAVAAAAHDRRAPPPAL